METEIATMEHQEHIYKLEKIQMAAELRIKEAVIVSQASDMLKLRVDFVMQVKKTEENEEKFKNSRKSLAP